MKAVCRDCGWKGKYDQVLTAKSPFDGDTIEGCPNCKAVNTMSEACVTDGCWKETTCGTPTPEGYKRTCGGHRPKDQPESQL